MDKPYNEPMLFAIMLMMMMATGCPRKGKKETPKKADTHTYEGGVHTGTGKVKKEPEASGGSGEPKKPEASGGFTLPPPPPRVLVAAVAARLQACIDGVDNANSAAWEGRLETVFGATDGSLDEKIKKGARIWAAIEELPKGDDVYEAGIAKIKLLSLPVDKEIPKGIPTEAHLTCLYQQ